ncbi:MAG: NAD-dependent epimerase/dehydratase family protein [Candidatus Aminicenantes bacterium]|nr:NAD-dependent epimerase/dehydratase family protein [Candidatus Aminicenantes bacterium]
MMNKKEKILVTGAAGQIGSELTPLLRERYGNIQVIASDIKTDIPSDLKDSGPFEHLDVLSNERLFEVVKKHRITLIFHMSAILSASGEQNPQHAWKVNIEGTRNILEISKDSEVKKLFIPSSIAAFGPSTPREDTPQETILRPNTVYGITKVAGELLSNYYVARYKLDVRGCRYPGIISHKTLPGGGTTDYAVAIFYEAVRKKTYTCFVNKETMLPMMYMPDCLKATLDLMDANFKKLQHHADFNVAGMSFKVHELAREIKKHIPDFTISYEPDYRQKIADTWPRTIDDSAARQEWGWEPEYDLSSMTEDMLKELRRRHQESGL